VNYYNVEGFVDEVVKIKEAINEAGLNNIRVMKVLFNSKPLDWPPLC
jgi:tRNA G46 methylase TrmB